MTISRGVELAMDAQFRELSNFSTPPRAGRITAIEASGQVRVETDDPDGGDVLAWPLNGFTYAVDDVVYLAFAVNSPDSAIVIGSLGHLPVLGPGVVDHGGTVGLGDDDHTQYALLAGRVGSQVVHGGNAANEDLTLRGTVHATKATSYVLLQDTGGHVGIGTVTPGVDVVGTFDFAYPTFTLLQVEGAQARFVGRGSGNTAFDFIHTGAGADAKWFSMQNNSGRASFYALTDGAGVGFILMAFDLATGQASVGLGSVNATVLGIKAGGSSSNDAAVGGVLLSAASQAGNVGAGEDLLDSYSVPANTLSVNGMSLWLEASGSCAANVNIKTLRVRFGTQVIFSATVTGAGGGAQWMVRGRIIRTGAATQKIYCSIAGTNITTVTAVNAGITQTLSAANTLQVTGEAVANNDIVIETFTVGWDDANS